MSYRGGEEGKSTEISSLSDKMAPSQNPLVHPRSNSEEVSEARFRRSAAKENLHLQLAFDIRTTHFYTGFLQYLLTALSDPW